MTPSPIVLVHGAWGGAWIWRRMLAPLRAAGHEVHAVTLTGDGERAHLRRPGITLQTHIADVLGLLEAEELREVVLVGHSYGGMVITGAADRATAADPAAIRRLIYLDAMIPLPGEGWGQQHDPAVVAARTAAARAHDHALPPPDPADFGLTGPDRDWLLRRQVPHPFGPHPDGPYQEPLPFDGERWQRLSRHFIDCHDPAYPTIATMRERARQLPGFTVHELATGHCPMVSAPQALARLLIELAG
ncbi:MAG: alpha/beta hydrolase [Burkholderiaceae bacterium]|nr:alpha/beta hydrolase [Burkholderiaceae bacterium]